MIRSVRANRPSFQEVKFEPGFNVVLADRTQESKRKDSRNGLGKSTLIDIIHFCLGANAPKGKGLRVPALSGWAFTLELTAGDRRLVVTRAVDQPSRFSVGGDVGGLGRDLDLQGHVQIGISEWRTFLGNVMFGLPDGDDIGKWSPTFRSLISYFARHGADSYSTPFEHTRKQQPWNVRVNNAFLLGLAWEDAQHAQVLREREQALAAVKRAAKSGAIEEMLGSIGEIEAEKVRLEDEAMAQATRLRSFRVHPEYEDIEKRASAITAQIHSLNNANIIERRRLSVIRSSADDIVPSDARDVAELFEAVGVELPGVATRRLSDVEEFHRSLVRNRREFLRSELDRLEGSIHARNEEIRALTDERAELLTILEKHGALEEYTRLQGHHLELVARIKSLENRLVSLRRFEEGRGALRIDRERLRQRARRDYDERREIRERAIRVFNKHSEALYQASGKLVADVADKGFTFDVEIERSGSSGVGHMKVLCYDLMLAELWAGRDAAPGFLVHDSTIFDGVDERQIAHAIVRAAQASETAGFQYICTMNSDSVPCAEFPESFDLLRYVRLILTDESPEESLLGIRF